MRSSCLPVHPETFYSGPPEKLLATIIRSAFESAVNQEIPEQEAYHQLCFYTLAHPDPSFIHQHVVDAYTAQHANVNTKPIALAFALIGLYLYIEKSYPGKQVQRAHMQMAKRRKQWPVFSQPMNKGGIAVGDVVAAPPGETRDEMLRNWCIAVWGAYHESHEGVASLVQAELWDPKKPTR